MLFYVSGAVFVTNEAPGVLTAFLIGSRTFQSPFVATFPAPSLIYFIVLRL